MMVGRRVAAAGRSGKGSVPRTLCAATRAPAEDRPVIRKRLSLTAVSASPREPLRDTGGSIMAESVYKIIELVGTSPDSWEKAALAAVTKAGETLRDIRIAEIADLDMHMEDGKVTAYRARVKLSFKYEE